MNSFTRQMLCRSPTSIVAMSHTYRSTLNTSRADQRKAASDSDTHLGLRAELAVLLIELGESVLYLAGGKCSPLVCDAVNHGLVGQDVLVSSLQGEGNRHVYHRKYIILCI